MTKDPNDFDVKVMVKNQGTFEDAIRDLLEIFGPDNRHVLLEEVDILRLGPHKFQLSYAMRKQTDKKSLNA